MPSDPSALIGLFLMAIVAVGLGWLLFKHFTTEKGRNGWGRADVLGVAAVVLLLWFLLWALTGGLIPHGLWGLAGSALALLLLVTTDPNRSR
ncbi:hypothetical protein C6T52_17065 [Burkholderia multivorans]|nr:hypothetical protein C6T52_17065 [Burkholderia multivorans]PRG62222.1 hypothetical protein C6T69_25675 [Burkholderia multivorans]